MAPATKSPARLWVLLASKAPEAVIFRRGPSKQVLLIKWNTRKDIFEIGQWFKGRIYERRCDLSPDGKLLIYFAANQKPPLYSWTAISKPPYLTALALWPKGDCWNGGGWFVGERKVRLNHDASQATLDRRFRLGPLKVVGYAEGWGEDRTVWNVVLERDGWHCVTQGKAGPHGHRSGWRLNPPAQWRKAHPKKKDLAIEMLITGIGGKGMPWYQTDYCVLRGSEILVDLRRADWAEWDHRGDLVFAKRGCLFRQRLGHSFSKEPTQIADFNALKFENVVAPDVALRW